MSFVLDVPPGWNSASVGKYCDVQLGKMLQSEPSGEGDALLPYLRAINVTRSGVDLSHEFSMWIKPQERSKFRLKRDDVLVSEGGDAGRTAYLETDAEYYFQNSINRVRPLDRRLIDPRFLYYWFTFLKLSGYVGMVCNVATIPHFTAEKVKASPLAFPRRETQRRITTYLDAKVAQIDGLIEHKQMLVQRLAEKRQAITTQAVTTGVNTTAATTDSGIDWLRQIPSHWKVKRLSFVARVIDCKHRTPVYVDQGIPLVSTSEISPYHIDYETKRQVDDAEMTLMSEGGRKPLLGDIIYSRNASVGAAALVREDRPLVLGQDLCLVRPFDADPRYLEHFLNSSACLGQLEGHLIGATLKRVNVDAIRKYVIPLPPLKEQQAIAALVDAMGSEIDRVMRLVRESVAALVEYRAAIIASAVTGRIEGIQ